MAAAGLKIEANLHPDVSAFLPEELSLGRQAIVSNQGQADAAGTLLATQGQTQFG